ncbi:hypothetical protein [Pseudomonas putida]|uniref:hypothetical protein n=1 Tax=Pseudomonas putida TaxID=303 RepID=UPI001E58888B|nr:hypothetical protein [Pseudomonas putida]MCC9007707.1 hypothetical protein [Pseudomonas putida]
MLCPAVLAVEGLPVQFFIVIQLCFRFFLTVLADSNTLEVFDSATKSDEKDRIICKKINEFAKNPHENKLKSALDDGTVF